MKVGPAAGGGRWVDVEPGRLARWIEGFLFRHGQPPAEVDERVEDRDGTPVVRLSAPDGSVAYFYAAAGAPPPESLDHLVDEARRPRRLGILLARQSAVAVGVTEGERLVVSKVDTSYVQGRTAAGGWSQHRFARRRENQAKAAAGGAADIAVRLLLPEAGRLAAVVTGGDHWAVDAVLADPRLEPLVALRTERFLDVPEPRLAVLQRAIPLARAVRILVRDADPPSAPA